jgi:hypothetical protein
MSSFLAHPGPTFSLHGQILFLPSREEKDYEKGKGEAAITPLLGDSVGGRGCTQIQRQQHNGRFCNGCITKGFGTNKLSLRSKPLPFRK